MLNQWDRYCIMHNSNTCHEYHKTKGQITLPACFGLKKAFVIYEDEELPQIWHNPEWNICFLFHHLSIALCTKVLNLFHADKKGLHHAPLPQIKKKKKEKKENRFKWPRPLTPTMLNIFGCWREVANVWCVCRIFMFQFCHI